MLILGTFLQIQSFLSRKRGVLTFQCDKISEVGPRTLYGLLAYCLQMNWIYPSFLPESVSHVALLQKYLWCNCIFIKQ